MGSKFAHERATQEVLLVLDTLHSFIFKRHLLSESDALGSYKDLKIPVPFGCEIDMIPVSRPVHETRVLNSTLDEKTRC